MATQKVHLRQKGLSKGMIGYYLDYSIKGNRRQETIKGIKTYSRPKNKSERDHNKNFEFKLNEIRNHREQELLSNYFGETILYKPKTTLVSFCECIMEEKRGMKKTYDVWKSMLVHLKRFDCNVQLGELNEQWQNKWQSYLLSQVSQNSAHSYNNKVRCAIKEAVERKYISSQRLVKSIPYKEVQREYLTQGEIQLMIDTPCESEQFKRAFLFSCNTGLRFTDIQQLEWRDFKVVGKENHLYFRQQKTNQTLNIPLKEDSMRFLDKSPNGSERVFKGLKYGVENNHKLAKWVLRAGIQKKITFHCARHSFAMLLLTNGTDPYTVSKLMGHQDMKSTLVYLKLCDELKFKAMNALPKFDVGNL